MEQSEIYVLMEKRELSKIRSFLDIFIKGRVFQGDVFCIPEFNCDNAKVIFYNEESILEYLINHPNEDYSLYWKSSKVSNIDMAMVFFTEDKNIIFGLVVIERAKEILEDLQSFSESNYGYITFEEVPPLNRKEFIKRCETGK